MMSHHQKILLKGGTVLHHTGDDRVTALPNTDILIVGEVISDIRKGIDADLDTKCIDCEGKIVSPGFIDTHHHVWQTQLKGRHSDDTLLDYHPRGNLQFYNYTPEDIFYGELGGLFEAIDAGTTTIVDHAHMGRSPDHVFAGVSATIATGIRSVFCYTLNPNIKEWNQEFKIESDPIPEWWFPTFEKVRDALQKTSGRVDLGFAFDNYFLPEATVKMLCKTARDYGARVITSHWRRNNMAADDAFSIPKILHDYGLLGPDILLSHGTGSTAEEFKLLHDAGAYISCTPATESQMAHGNVVAFKDGVLASLGADCHSNNPGSILHAMQIGLAVARSHHNEAVLSRGKFPSEVKPKTVEAFNLATICGARAIGLEKKIGSLEKGKSADIVIFNTSSPVMCCAADEDPLVAVVRHASPQDVDTVIIGGQIRKEKGVLLDANLKDDQELLAWAKGSSIEGTGAISWAKVAHELRRSRREVLHRVSNCRIDSARQAVVKMWGVRNPEKLFE